MLWRSYNFYQHINITKCNYVFCSKCFHLYVQTNTFSSWQSFSLYIGFLSLFSRFSLLFVLNHSKMFCIVSQSVQQLLNLDIQIIFFPLPFCPPPLPSPSSPLPSHPSILLPSSQRVFQGEREGQGTWRLPETQRKTATGGGPQGRLLSLCVLHFFNPSPARSTLCYRPFKIGIGNLEARQREVQKNLQFKAVSLERHWSRSMFY